MKRWIAPGVLALFVVGMLTYGMNIYHQEQIEQAKEPVRGEITVYTDLPNNLTTMLAERYEAEQNVKVTIMPLTEDQMAQRSASTVADTSGDLVLTSEDNLVVGANTGKYAPIVNERIDEVRDTFKDPNGYWVGLWYDPIVFAVNQDYLKKSGQVPSKWSDLAQDGKLRLAITDFLAADAAATNANNKAVVAQALVASGLGDYVKPDYNANSLSAYVRAVAEEHGGRDTMTTSELRALLPEPLAAVLKVADEWTIGSSKH